MRKLIAAFVHEAEGQDLIEYALLAATIALGIVLAMQGLRDALSTAFGNIGTSIGS